MGFKPARRLMFTDHRKRIIVIMTNCNDLVGSLCKSFILKKYPNLMKSLNIPT